MAAAFLVVVSGGFFDDKWSLVKVVPSTILVEVFNLIAYQSPSTEINEGDSDPLTTLDCGDGCLFNVKWTDSFNEGGSFNRFGGNGLNGYNHH